MTASDLFARARAALASALVGAVLALGAAGALWWSCGRPQPAPAPGRAAEEAGAHQAGVPVVEQVTPEAFKAFATQLLAENARLQQALDEARRAVPGSVVTGAIQATVEGVAHGKPRPTTQDTPPAASGGAAGPAPAGAPSTPAVAGTCSEPTCLLADGDGLALKLEGLELSGPAGGRYLVGTQKAIRKADGEVLLSEAFAGEHVKAAEVAPEAPLEPGWAGGVTAAWHHQPLVGLVLAPPPKRWWRFQLEPSVAASCQPGGEVLGICQKDGGAMVEGRVLVRWMRRP